MIETARGAVQQNISGRNKPDSDNTVRVRVGTSRLAPSTVVARAGELTRPVLSQAETL
jgi:hypothetical protein